MNRSTMREQAFKLIYSLEMQKQENLENQLDLYIEANNIENNDAIEYIKEAIQGIEEKKEKNIAKNKKNRRIGSKL